MGVAIALTGILILGVLALTESFAELPAADSRLRGRLVGAESRSGRIERIRGDEMTQLTQENGACHGVRSRCSSTGPPSVHEGSLAATVLERRPELCRRLDAARRLT